MRFTPFFLSLVLLLPACGHHAKPALSSDDKRLRELPGTWFFVAKFEKGSDETITTTVAPDGSYVSIFAIPERKLGPRTIRQEGSWRVEDGFLIETVTMDSQTNASVPSTNRTRIIRLDEHELELDLENIPGAVYPTNQVIFRRQAK